MPLQVQCPNCGKSATLPDSAVGKKIKCSCGNICIAPAAAVPLSASESSGELALQPIAPPKLERKSGPQVAPMSRPEPVAGGERNPTPRSRRSRQPDGERSDSQAKSPTQKPPPAQAIIGCLLALGVFYLLYHLVFDHSGTGVPSPNASAPPVSVQSATPSATPPVSKTRTLPGLNDVIHQFERTELGTFYSKDRIRALIYVILTTVPGEEERKEVLQDALTAARFDSGAFSGLNFGTDGGEDKFYNTEKLEHGVQMSLDKIYAGYKTLLVECKKRGTTIEAEAKQALGE